MFKKCILIYVLISFVFLTMGVSCASTDEGYGIDTPYFVEEVVDSVEFMDTGDMITLASGAVTVCGAIIGAVSSSLGMSAALGPIGWTVALIGGVGTIVSAFLDSIYGYSLLEAYGY